MFILPFLKNALEYRSSSKYSLQEMQTKREKKFRKMLSFIKDKSNYYRDIIDEYRLDIETCQLTDFPILDKQKAMTNFNNIVTDKEITKEKIIDFLTQSVEPTDLFLDKYIVVQTSGSSGVIGYFPYNLSEAATGIAHGLKTHGLKLGQRVAFVGTTRGHFTGVSIAQLLASIPFVVEDVANIDINDPLSTIIEKLNGFQPTMLIGYANGLVKLAEAQLDGRLNIQPIVVDSSGEMLTLPSKLLIEKVFNVKVGNLYICSEHFFLGLSEPGQIDMSLCEDNLIIEIMPDHILVTNLFNQTFPLIRYRMNDILTLSGKQNEKLPYRQIINLVGRQENTPVFKNQKGELEFLHPVAIDNLFVPNLLAFQMHVTSQTSFIFKVKIYEFLPDQEKSKTLNLIHEKLKLVLLQKNMENVNFSIQEVQHLESDARTGKFRLVVGN